MNNLKINSCVIFVKCFFRQIVEKRITIQTYRKFSSASNSYRIRNITEDEIPKIADIRKTNNLHSSLSCLYSFYKVDPEGIIVAEDKEGLFVGTHCMLNFAEGLYISGLTYVHHNYRKSNMAYEMIRGGAVRHRQKDRLLTSFTFKQWAEDAEEVVGIKMYLGFMAKRYVSTENVDLGLLSDELPSDVAIHPFENSYLEIMYDYDYSVAGYERRKFLELSCNEPNTKTAIAVKNGRCVGFATVKLSCPGAKRIGPLYADDPKIAEALLKSVLTSFQEGKGTVMVIANTNQLAEKMVNKLGMTFCNGYYQIYEKDFPQADVLKVYAHFDINGTSI